MSDIYEMLNQIGSAKLDHVNPGGVRVKVAEITQGDGSFPLNDILTEIHIFEDIERIGITGFLKVHDNLNIFQAGPLIGHELLYLQLETNGASDAGVPSFGLDFTTHPLFIYKIEDMISPDLGAGHTAWLDYRIHFCSPEMLRNERIRISKTYQGTIDEIVKRVLEEEIRTKKDLDIAKTLDLYHKIAPNVRPYKFITDLVPEAQTGSDQEFDGARNQQTGSNTFKGTHNDFLFYETSTRSDGGGFHFVPSISKAGSPNLTFTLSNSTDTLGFNVSPTQGTHPQGGWANMMLTSTSYRIKFLGDKYRSISSGVWAGKLIQHSPYTKSFKVYYTDYYKHLKNPNHSLISETDDYNSDKSVSEFPNSRVKYFSSSGTRSYSEIINEGVIYPWEDTPDEKPLLRTMQLGHILGSHRIEFTIPGCSRLSVGEYAECILPNIGFLAGQESEPGAVQLWENRLNNYWLVTKVAHKVILKGKEPYYSTTVEVANSMRKTGRVLKDFGGLGSSAGGEE